MSEVFIYFTSKDATYSFSMKRCMYQNHKLSHIYKEKKLSSKFTPEIFYVDTRKGTKRMLSSIRYGLLILEGGLLYIPKMRTNLAWVWAHQWWQDGGSFHYVHQSLTYSMLQKATPKQTITLYFNILFCMQKFIKNKVPFSCTKN